MTTARAPRRHWVVRVVAISGIPYGLLLAALHAFVAFALLFNGHPATSAGVSYFLVSTVLVLVDIGCSIALLAGRGGAFTPLLVVTGAELVAALIYVGASFVIGSIEAGQLMQWIAMVLVPLRFLGMIGGASRSG